MLFAASNFSRSGNIWRLVISVMWLVVADNAGAEQALDPLTPPGRMVAVGGKNLHIYCRGSGTPAIVLDAGLGGVSAEWFVLQRRLAALTQVCSYDRAGMGWSDPASGPRTSVYLVSDLYGLLKNAGIQGPYILVGHSFGGINAQLFARRYPNETAGLVLLDSSHPEQVERFLAPPIALNTAPSKRGMVQFANPMLPANLPEELVTPVMQLIMQGKSRHAMVEEYFGFRESLQRVATAGPLPDVPVIVVSHGRRIWPNTTKGDLIERLWVELQADLINGVTRAAHLIASNSGHHIHLDQPNLVWDAAAELITLYRQAADDNIAVTGREWLAFENAIWLSDTLHAPHELIAATQ
jgi:pimeloyl-ACP methyl ester carboxylesterase